MYGIGASCSGANSIVFSLGLESRTAPTASLWGTLSILSRPVRLYSERSPKGGEHESSAGTGWHAEGRLRHDVRWRAQAVGGEWSALRGLGDVPHQGISGR